MAERLHSEKSWANISTFIVATVKQVITSMLTFAARLLFMCETQLEAEQPVAAHSLKLRCCTASSHAFARPTSLSSVVSVGAGR